MWSDNHRSWANWFKERVSTDYWAKKSYNKAPGFGNA